MRYSSLIILLACCSPVLAGTAINAGRNGGATTDITFASGVFEGTLDSLAGPHDWGVGATNPGGRTVSLRVFGYATSAARDADQVSGDPVNATASANFTDTTSTGTMGSATEVYWLLYVIDDGDGGGNDPGNDPDATATLVDNNGTFDSDDDVPAINEVRDAILAMGFVGGVTGDTVHDRVVAIEAELTGMGLDLETIAAELATIEFNTVAAVVHLESIKDETAANGGRLDLILAELQELNDDPGGAPAAPVDLLPLNGIQPGVMAGIDATVEIDLTHEASAPAAYDDTFTTGGEGDDSIFDITLPSTTLAVDAQGGGLTIAAMTFDPDLSWFHGTFRNWLHAFVLAVTGLVAVLMIFAELKKS